MRPLACLSLLVALVASPCVPGKLAYAQIGPNRPGPQGEPGEDFGVDYLFQAAAATTDPGSGHLGLNDADASLATTLVLSETNADAVNVAGWLASLDDSTSATKGHLVVRRATDSTVYRIFTVEGVVDSGTFWTLSIDLLSQNGNLVDDDGLKIAFLPTGDKGETGSAGSQGIQGETGPAGSPGSDGDSAYEVAVANGFMGDEAAWLLSLVGETGPAGMDGSDGAPGMDGSDGEDGLSVLSGTSPPGSGLGVDGQFYIEYGVDPDEWFVYGPKAGGAWPAGVSVRGPPGVDGMDGSDGVAGQDGKTWLSGTAAPTNGLGQNGDYYLDTDDHAYYGPKSGGTWSGTGPTSLIGPAGSDGSDGVDGASAYEVAVAEGFMGDEAAWLASLVGEDGMDGAAGADGRTWYSGTPPPSDATGANGDYYLDTDDHAYYGPKASGTWTGTGPTSLVGPTGATGSAGADGRTVLNGTSDPTTEGANGDFYIKTSGTPSEWKIFGPKASGSWPAGVALQGPTGATGAAGADGRDAGWNYKFNTSTSGDPGSGKLLFNNATLGSATTFRIHKTDDDGNDLSAVTALWDDSASFIRGYLTIKKVGAPTTYVVFGIYSDDPGGLVNYREYSCTVASTSGTFSNNDETMISFVQGAPEDPRIPSGGNASTPGLPVDGDANTGLLADVADQLAVTTGGTERGRWSSTGLTMTNGVFVAKVSSHSPSTGTHNNYAVALANVVVIDTSGGNVTLTGLDMPGVVDGVCVDLRKKGGNSLTLNHADTNSSAANRFNMNGAVNSTHNGGNALFRLIRHDNSWTVAKLTP